MSEPWAPDLNANKHGLQWDVFNSQARFLLVEGPRYSAKCVDAGTLLVCDGALTRIGSLCRPYGLSAGESAGCSHTVTSLDCEQSRFVESVASHVYRDGCSEGYSLSTDGGYSLRCSTWHPLWSCSDGRFDYRTSTEIASLLESGKSVWLPLVKGASAWTRTTEVVLEFPSANRWHLKNEAVGQRIRAAIAEHGNKNWNRISRTAKTHYRCVKRFFDGKTDLPGYSVVLTPDVAYLIGVLTGDGCLRDLRNRREIKFSSNDLQIVDEVRRISRQFGGAVKHEKGCDWVITGGRSLKDLCLFLNLDKYAHEKTIPDCIVSSPKPVVRAFLQGLFDTDGTAGKLGFVSYCSSSEPLAKDVHQLLLAFGIRANCSFKRNRCRGAWLVSVYGDADVFYKEVGFRLERKQAGLIRLWQKERERSAYPDSVRDVAKAAYMSRHERGAPRGNLPRTVKHSGFDSCFKPGGKCISEDTLANLMEFSFASCDAELSRYFLEGKAFWEKVKSVSRAKVELYDLSVPGHHNFIGSGFVNHNTWAVLHRIIRHLYDTPAASFAMFSPTIKNSKEGGTWQSLHRVTIPEWINAGIGFNYTSLNNDGKPGWKVIGDTRTPYFSIRNRYGGQSECRLFSLDHVPDVVDKVKSQEFSGIYFPELMTFDKEDSDRIVLSTTQACLRMPHLRYEDHLWIADTNPSPRGPDSWIYKTWFVEPKQTYEEYAHLCEADGYDPMTAEDWRKTMSERQVITMIPEDNLRLDPRLLLQLKQHCQHDPGLYARDVMGKWIWGDGDQSRHFRSFFKPDIHVRGNIEFASEEDYEVIKPSRGSVDLVTGFDTGDTNHAAVILDRLYIGDRKHFNVLEELESIGKSGRMENFADRKGDWVSIEDFTIAFMGLIEDIEADAGRKFDLEPAYSDSSALEKYSAAGNTYTALEILAASRGRLTVIGVPKPNGSVHARINLVKKLLSQGRLRVSAQCVAVQRMFRDLKKGAGRLNFVVNDENKHIFDALSYPLIAECAEEIVTQEDRMNVGRRKNGGGAIHL